MRAGRVRREPLFERAHSSLPGVPGNAQSPSSADDPVMTRSSDDWAATVSLQVDLDPRLAAVVTTIDRARDGIVGKLIDVNVAVQRHEHVMASRLSEITVLLRVVGLLLLAIAGRVVFGWW